MSTLKIKNWDKWQTFRKDRGTPPWIKLHRNLMSNPEWAILTDSEKGQLVSIWIIAADKSGEIPDNPNIIRKVCILDETPNISKFIELGFIESNGSQHDNQMTTKCQQDDQPEQSRAEESREDKTLVTDVTKDCPHNEIIKIYHDKLPMLPQVKIWNDARKKLLRTRWKESENHQSLEFWNKYFSYVSKSMFLTCRNEKVTFTPNLEWLIKPTNFAKVIEGTYHNDKKY